MTLYLTKSRFKLALGTEEAEMLHERAESIQDRESDDPITNDDR